MLLSGFVCAGGDWGTAGFVKIGTDGVGFIRLDTAGDALARWSRGDTCNGGVMAGGGLLSIVIPRIGSYRCPLDAGLAILGGGAVRLSRLADV